MDKVVPASMLPLYHIAVAVQLRNDTVHHGQAAEERITLTNLCCLFPEGLCKAVEALSSTHDDTAVFAVLRDDLQHFRREVLRLVGAKPVLHFINAGYHALNAVLIAYQQPPIIQLGVLTAQSEIRDTLGFRVFLAPFKGLLFLCP